MAIWGEWCNADDFVNALVDYYNHNEIRNMTSGDLDLCNYDCQIFDVSRTEDTLDFRFECCDNYLRWLIGGFIPFVGEYCFKGDIHIDYPQIGLLYPYTLNINPWHNGFTAKSPNCVFKVESRKQTIFY